MLLVMKARPSRTQVQQALCESLTYIPSAMDKFWVFQLIFSQNLCYSL